MGSNTRDTALELLRSTTLDTEDRDLSAFIYNMILGNFGMFFNDSEVDYIQNPPIKVMVHLMNYLQKFPFSVT